MPITEAEFRNAVIGMKTGKSLSINGFTAEYYHKSMDIIAPVLTEVYEEAGCTVGSTVALQREGPGFYFWPGVLLHGVCMFSLCMRGFSPDTPASSHSPKT
ncbi:hypothetical protein XENORESO_019341 [Xenotaenia resolanae]|uniref:Uncharacterized protein n=1 Tax=Xenotaenia resolanae TaxID=208358 RepID=A0ABV0VS65_9TELE